MNDRRNFIRGFGLFGAVLAGAATAKVTIEEKKTEVEDISHLAPEDPTTLVLQGNRTKETRPTQTNGLCFLPYPEYQNKVHLSAGKDDRLWMKVGEKWCRVSIEG